MDSNGNYDFTGTSTVTFGELGFSITGTGTFHLEDNAFSGAFSGSGCAPAVGCLTTTGSINNNRRLRG